MSTTQKTVQLAETSALGREGEVVQLALTPSDVHYAAEMESFLAGYKPFAMRADEVSPPILVDKDEDYYRIFDSDDAFLEVACEGGLEADIPQTQVTSATSKYSVVNRFIGSFISDVTEQNASALYRCRQRSLKRCATIVSLRRERVLATLLTTSGNWTAANVDTLVAAERWNGGGSSDPIQNIQDLMAVSAQQVTDIWMPEKVSYAFLRHASVRDHMRQLLGDNPATIGTDMLDYQIPGLPPIHVLPAKYRATAGGTITPVWGTSCILTCTPPGTPTDGEEVATSYTFRRRGNAGVGYETREFRVENRGPKGGTMVVVEVADVPKMTGSNCGGLIENAIA